MRQDSHDRATGTLYNNAGKKANTLAGPQTETADSKTAPASGFSSVAPTVSTAPARITVFTSVDKALCKRFTLKGDRIDKQTLAVLYRGSADVIDAATAADLNAALDGLHHRQAIATGVLKQGNAAAIGTASQAAKVSRSLAHFAFPKGQGWLLWDYDDKTMPPEVSARVQELGGPLAALFHIWPEAQSAAHVVRPSSSDGITAPNMPPMQSAGLHGFFLVQDVSQSKAILDTLEQRAWGAGLAWYALSGSGAMLARSIVDTAVGSPERLVFEAPPILDAPVIRLPRPAIVKEGAAIAPPALPLDIAADAQTARDQAGNEIKPKAEKAEAAFIETRARTEADKTGQPLNVARTSIVRMMRGAILTDNHMLQLKSGVWARVGDLLDAGENISLPDPIEGIAYGRDKASLRIKPRPAYPNEKPALVSHAHGQRVVYRFARYITPPKPPFHPEPEGNRADNIRAHGDIARGFIAAQLTPIRASKAVKAIYAEIDELDPNRKALQTAARKQVRADMGLDYIPTTRPLIDPKWWHVLLSGAQGVGKSAALVGRTDADGNSTAGALHQTHGLVTLMTAPDNAKANELALDYDQNAPEGAPPWFRLMGRSVKDPQTGQTACLVAKPIEDYAKKGGNVMAFCQVCPLRDQCRYLAEIGRLKALLDAGEGVVIFAPQEYAFLPLPASVTPDIVVMDEALRNKGATLETVTLDALAEPLRAEDTGRAQSLFSRTGEQADAAAANLRHIQPLRVALRRGFTDTPHDPYSALRDRGLGIADLTEALAALHLFEEKALEDAARQAATEFEFASVADGRKRSLEAMLQKVVDAQDAKHSKAVKALFAAVLGDLQKDSTNNIGAWRGRKGDDFTDSVNAAALMKPHFTASTPLLLLDGTADGDMAAAIFGELTHHHLRVARNANVTQIIGHSFSAQSITGERKNGTPHYPEKAEATRRGILQAVAQYKNALVGSTARVEAALNADGLTENTAHYSAIRGRNTWENAPAVFLVGPEEPPAAALEPIARAYAAADPATLTFESIGAHRYPRETRFLRMADKTAVGIDVSCHPDPWTERVLRQTRDAEALQLIDRARLIYNATPKRVFILAPVVLDLTVNEVVQWRDFKAGGNRINRATAQSGVLPLSKGPLRAMYPTVWNSDGAAQRDLSGVVELVKSLTDHSVNNNILFTQWSLKGALLIDYQQAPQAGKRMRRQRALVWADSLDAAQQRLEAVTGPLQSVQDVDGWIEARDAAQADIDDRAERIASIRAGEGVQLADAVRIADTGPTQANITPDITKEGAAAPFSIQTHPPPLVRASQ